ncbi:MAG: hypothetical protein JW781_02210 [Deltaproteobacteria bacterium]|nr:hypothetical protein [Candidatus Anaeroferrophillacea bacterium]
MTDRIYIHKPDLDTCLTALILGVGPHTPVVVLPGEAPAEILAAPACRCIEVGGSGQVARNNYDHHDPRQYFPPACRQAFARLPAAKRRDAVLMRLVDYVCLVDDPPPGGTPAIPFPSLSNLFSGMLLTTAGTETRFWCGVELLETVRSLGCDPFAPLPRRPEWQPYLDAREENTRQVVNAGIVEAAEIFTTASGLCAGYIALPPEQAGLIVGPGALYRRGCDIAVIYSPAFGDPPQRKFTIAGNNRPVSHLLPRLTEREPGWGGRECIIGSPRDGGSRLPADEVVDLVRRYG